MGALADALVNAGMKVAQAVTIERAITNSGEAPGTEEFADALIRSGVDHHSASVISAALLSVGNVGGGVGPAGPQGPAGPSASVTSSAVQAALTADPAGARTAMGAASAAQGAKADTAVQLDANGRLPALDGRNLTRLPFRRLVQGRRGVTQTLGAPFAAGDVLLNAGSATITLENGPKGTPAVKIVTAVNANVEIRFPTLVDSYFHGDVFMSAQADYGAPCNVDYMTLYVSQNDASYANGAQAFWQYGLTAPTMSAYQQGGANSYQKLKAQLTPIGTPTYPMRVGQAKLTIVPRSGTSATVWLYGLSFGAPARKGRICITSDDGYRSFMALGFPEFAARDIPVTMAIIPQNMGIDSVACTDRELRGVVAAGGAVVPHGASTGGNLFNSFGTTAARLADMELCRDLIAARGYDVAGWDRCYVWPEGAFAASYGDLALLDAAWAAGFRLIRGTSNYVADGLYPRGVRIDTLTRYNKLAVGHIGHTWAGTTAAEATNISNITAAINNVAASGSDAILMLHRVLPDTTNDAGMGGAGNITIRRSDLATIASTIAARIADGTLEAVTMPQLSYDTVDQDLA